MIHIAVCDNEQTNLNHTVKMLHSILKESKRRFRITPFLSATALLNNTEIPDIVIVDMAIKEIDGIMLGKLLKEKYPDIRLIYLSIHEKHCMQAINDVHAFSYLCKPIDRSELVKQITALLADIPDPAIEKEFHHVTDSFGTKYSVIKLSLDDILYFSCIKRQRKITIITAQETYEYKCIFKELEKELKPYDFTVNSRGMLVNLGHVRSIRGNTLFLDNGKELPIAQKRIVDFRNRLHTFYKRSI